MQEVIRFVDVEFILCLILSTLVLVSYAVFLRSALLIDTGILPFLATFN